MDAALIIEWIIKSIVLILICLTGFAYLTLYERKALARIQVRIGPNRAGPFGLFQTFADMLKLIFKEDLIPAGADRLLFQLAPVLAVAGVVGLWAVIPLAGTAYGVDLNVGVLYLIASGTIATLGILMAGWASNNKFALLGAFRAVAQMVAYEVPMVLAALVPVLLAGTMSLQGIVRAQGEMWFGLSAPLAALVFLIAALAEVSRVPFELLEAESEIVAGFHVEYSGIRFGMFFAAEFLHAFTFGALIAVLFLGGWQGPYAEEYPTLAALYFILKSGLAYFLFVWVRATLPRIRIDQMLDFSWAVLTPVMLILLCLMAVTNRALQEEPFLFRHGALLAGNLFLGLSALILLGRQARRLRREARARAGMANPA